MNLFLLMNLYSKWTLYLKNSRTVRNESDAKAILLFPFRFLKLVLFKIKSTPKYIYRKISKNAIFFQESEMGMCSIYPKKKLDKTIGLFKPKSVLDLGCGVGKSLDHFKQKGIKVVGVEGSALAISKARNPELIIKYNLNNELNLNRKFDLIWSFEFVEHIHPDFVDNLLKTFSNHSDKIVLSAAPPGQGGEGHFNMQPPQFWIDKFKKCGYTHNKKKTDVLKSIDEAFSKNMLVFER